MARDRTQLVISLALLALFVVGVVALFGQDLRAFVAGPALSEPPRGRAARPAPPVLDRKP